MPLQEAKWTPGQAGERWRGGQWKCELQRCPSLWALKGVEGSKWQEWGKCNPQGQKVHLINACGHGDTHGGGGAHVLLCNLNQSSLKSPLVLLIKQIKSAARGV